MGEVSKAQFKANVSQFRIFNYKVLIKGVSRTLLKVCDELARKSSASLIR